MPAMIQLLCPIKQGMRIGANKNTAVRTYRDLFACQTQSFGSNPQIYSQFKDSFGQPLIGHNGLDFGYEDGTEVFASHDGRASYSEDSAKGFGITLVTTGYKTIYWHFKDSPITLNEWKDVKAGEFLGHGDSTGFSTGPHLHYGLKLLDSNGNVLNRDNGYDGAVDPTKYIVMDMNDFVTVDGKEVWLIKDGQKSHMYNAKALVLTGSFANVRTISQAELDVVPDSGFEIAALQKE